MGVHGHPDTLLTLRLPDVCIMMVVVVVVGRVVVVVVVVMMVSLPATAARLAGVRQNIQHAVLVE